MDDFMEAVKIAVEPLLEPLNRPRGYAGIGERVPHHAASELI